MQSLLDRAPLLRSRDLETTRAFYSAKGTRFELIGNARGSPPDAHVNGIFLSNVWLGYVEFREAAVALHLSPDASSFRVYDRQKAPASADAPRSILGDYYLHIPLQGRLEAAIPGRTVDCDRNRGVVISPGTELTLRAGEGAARLSVAIRGDALTRQLAALLGNAPGQPVRFDPALRLDERHGRSLAGMLRWTAHDFERDGGMFVNPLIAAQFEQFVLNWVLLAQPGSHSAAVRARDRPIAPRDVRRVLDFLHAHAAQPLTLPDLVGVSGVAGRTLLKHFRDAYGVSPMRYLREVRLQRVRSELASGAANQVGPAASRWGFTHAGRFSVEYRQRFGESPSQTLKSGRRPA